jgi:hypothetical protein
LASEALQKVFFISFQEFGFCVIWTFFYLLAASLVAAYGAYDEAFAAAAVCIMSYLYCVETA